MAEEKNIPDSGKVGEYLKPGRLQSVKADSTAQNQSTLAKAETTVVESASKAVMPSAEEKLSGVIIFERHQLNNKNTAEDKSSAVFGPSGETRTPDILLPNG